MSPDSIRAAILADPALLAKAQATPPDTVAIAAALSATRTRPVHTEIGAGTILAQLGAAGRSGGAFLDALVAIGASNRDVYWTMDLIKQGRLRIDLAATRAGMQGLAASVPSLAPDVAELLKLGVEPDPVDELNVRRAIFADDGQRLV